MSFRSMGRSSHNYSLINRIMLRFRPIAPKPTESKPLQEEEEEICRVLNRRKRPKRKYVRVRRSRRQSTKQCYSSPPPEKSGGTEEEDEELSSPEKVMVTLQLLPDRSTDQRDHEEKISCNSSSSSRHNQILLESLNLNNNNNNLNEVRYDPGTTALRSVWETLIVVERVTDTYAAAGVGLGFWDDEEKVMKSLPQDTCPAFVSDGENNVVWVNEAYRRMVAEEEEEEERGFVVWLVVKEELPRNCPSFACRVRLIKRKGQGQEWNRIVPCDVWRMQLAAGFAWKLDVNTALAL